MKRVGLRNKIIAQYWQHIPPADIKKNLGCSQQTINKWLKPLQDTSHAQLPQKLLSLGWSAGELIRVLKIDENELHNLYGISFKARGKKSISDEQLITLLDNEHSPQEIAEITQQPINHVRTRLRDMGWVKPKN